jgi:hypothetical protein
MPAKKHPASRTPHRASRPSHPASRPTHVSDEEKAAAGTDWPGKPPPGEPPVPQPPQVQARLEAEEGGDKPPRHKKAHDEYKSTAADKKFHAEREKRREETAHKPVHWKDIKGEPAPKHRPPG